MQELEKEKQQKAMDEGQQGSEMDKPILKFMISGEAPVLMSKACELLIKDLSFRAWRHTERNRRRTLQRQDLHAAVGESEVYDFLIDIVPRVTASKNSVSNPVDAAAAAAAAAMTPSLPPGMPMGSIPTSLPTVAPPMGALPATDQAVPGNVDNGMIQQMQHQHQPGQHPQQHGQATMIQHQYTDPQQHHQQHHHQQHHHYQYMGLPQAPAAEMNQHPTQVSINTGSQPQAVPQWQTQQVHDTGGNNA